MEWQSVVFALQILLLATSWTLFQRARAELTAQAAETPVLSEVKALQRNVKQLLAEIVQTAGQTSERLETRCAEAGALLAEMERKLDTLNSPVRSTGEMSSSPTVPLPTLSLVTAETAVIREEPARAAKPTFSERFLRRQAVYERADAGQPPVAIARETGMSEGEVETLLGLRGQRSS